MKQLLIAKNVAYAAKIGGGTAASPAELADGALGVFLKDGTLLTGANSASLADKKEIFVAVGFGDSLIRTPDIQRDGIVDYRTAEYKAPVRQVTTIDLTDVVFVGRDDVAVTTADYRHKQLEAIVRVIDTMPANIAPNIQSDSTAVRPSDTPTTIAARLAEAITKNQDSKVSASAAGPVLTLTDKRDGGHFRVAIDGVLFNGAEVVYTTAFDPGSGTFAQLEPMERLSLAFANGVHSQAGGRGELAVPLSVSAGTNYDMIFIDIVNRHSAKHGMDATFGRGLEFCIAIPDGNAASGVLASIFAPVFNSQGTAQDSEPAAETVVD